MTDPRLEVATAQSDADADAWLLLDAMRDLYAGSAVGESPFLWWYSVPEGDRGFILELAYAPMGGVYLLTEWRLWHGTRFGMVIPNDATVVLFGSCAGRGISQHERNSVVRGIAEEFLERGLARDPAARAVVRLTLGAPA